MATYDIYSYSPQVSDVASPQHRVSGPITPIHSPHHSLQSSISLRTPLHTLSIHEYRKQQSTPLSWIATPLGKTLRRKASTFALNEIGRVPSKKPALHRDSHSSSRPLHSSYSAHQLAPQSSVLGTQPVSDQTLRSQSAEPLVQAGSTSSIATADSQVKTRHFGSRKRLPRPPAPIGSELRFQSNAPVRPAHQIRANLPAPLCFFTEESNLSDAQATPTPSLPRFPQPPHFETVRETQREKAISFTTTAPATPPATPATIHYRGASFDLVNPHTSLSYHDIVTPSRDIDSSELLPLQSPEDSQLSVSEVMAPKRPLYGDLNAAHAGIVRCTEDTHGSSILEFPLPPTPVAISAGSSKYTSPVYSPESRFAPSPLIVKKAPNESRFSIRQLTRTFTKRLTKPPEHNEEEELQQFRERNASNMSISADDELLHPLEQTYIPTNRSTYFPISPVSPRSSTSPASLHDLGSISGDDDVGIEYARRDPGRHFDSKDLTSMVPDDLSTQIGRTDDTRGSVFVSESGVQPYYDDLAFMYAISSTYTVDDLQRSAYQQSLAGNPRSSASLRYSGVDAGEMADDYSYSHLARSSQSATRPLTQELYHNSVAQDDGKTDTISKFIDQYDLVNTTTNSLTTQDLESAHTTGLIGPFTRDMNEGSSKAGPNPAALPGLGEFEFNMDPTRRLEDTAHTSESAYPIFTRERAPNHQPGLPPSALPPLAPAFQYDQVPKPFPRSDLSEVFSNRSYTSYGDTQNLLQLPQPEVGESNHFALGFQPSSSYSQSNTRALEPSSSYLQHEVCASPRTPQEALDHAELIFDKAVTERELGHKDIPAMWGRQSSVNLLRSKRLTDGFAQTVDIEKADWETVAGDSQQGRTSLDSIADYSSSEGSRNSLGPTAAVSLSSWTEQGHARVPSLYSHAGPIRAHAHPFTSTPPYLAARPSSQTAPDVSASGTPSNPPTSSTVPVFRFSNQPRHRVEEPYAFAPWADLYALNDKETQELLASGPNDDVLFDSDVDDQSKRLSYRFKRHDRRPKSSPSHSIGNESGLECENAVDKLTIVGPKGNLTGTLRGTGMQCAGSSVADTSSPGAKLSSSVGPHNLSPDYDGFYASPFPATGSVTCIRQSRSAGEHQHERMLSQLILFPNAYNMEPVQSSSPLVGPDRRRSLRISTTFKPTRRASRAAVPGQTTLRQMVLAPDSRSTVPIKDAHFSPFMSVGGSRRPSTSDTATPLHPTHSSLDISSATRSGKAIVADQHSPHLLCPEREVKEEDEVRRRKLSWLIFACFCILPPCMFLYRMWGDSIILSITEGDLGHCTLKSKRAALIAGVVVNIGLITAILVPILVAQAMKAI